MTDTKYQRLVTRLHCALHGIDDGAIVRLAVSLRYRAERWRMFATNRANGILNPAAFLCPPPPNFSAIAATSTLPRERSEHFTSPSECVYQSKAKLPHFSASRSPSSEVSNRPRSTVCHYTCRRAFKTDQLCALNFDQGR